MAKNYFRSVKVSKLYIVVSYILKYLGLPNFLRKIKTTELELLVAPVGTTPGKS